MTWPRRSGIADRIAMLAAGKIFAEGTPKEVPASERPELREFIEISGLAPKRAPEMRKDGQKCLPQLGRALRTATIVHTFPPR